MLLNILLALLILVGVALTGIVLLQRSEGGALGMGGGGGQLISARGASNFLTKTTWMLGTAFFVLSLLITLLLGRTAGSDSITEKLKIEALDPAKMASDLKAQQDAEKANQALPGLPTLPPPAAPGAAPAQQAPADIPGAITLPTLPTAPSQ